MPVKEKYCLQIQAPDRILREEYVMAFSRAQAWALLKLRAVKEGWDYLLSIDSLNLSLSEEPKAPVQSFPLKPKKKKPEEYLWKNCPRCRNELDDDYCQNCGWRRFSRWYGSFKKESSIKEAKSP